MKVKNFCGISRCAARTLVLIPAYQPARALVELCEALDELGFPILCVDDGSGSEFDSLFRAVGSFAVVLRYRKNRGKGGALKYGMRYAAQCPDYAGADYLLTADADGQHRPEDICRVAEEVCRFSGLVLGARAFTGSVPLRSRIGNTVTRGVFRFASGSGAVSDTQTGLRAFPLRELPLYLQTAGEGYEYEMNVLFAAVQKGVPIREVPIETVYEDGNRGSHFRTGRDSWRICRAIFRASVPLKYLASSLIPSIKARISLLS